MIIETGNEGKGTMRSYFDPQTNPNPWIWHQPYFSHWYRGSIVVRENPMFPYEDSFEIAGRTLSSKEVLAHLAEFVTPERQQKIERVVSNRTYSVVPVLDGLYDRGNVSAVMRSAEAMGYQSLHLVETQEKFKAANRVTQGTDKWLDIQKWTDPTVCATHLKERGYQIVVTHLDAAVPLDQIDFTKPTAIVLGNERDGVSPEMVEASDAAVIIPMDGFVQSFNISVAAAISLYHIRLERVRRLGQHADLSEDQQRILRAHYYLRTVNHPEKLIEHALDRIK